MKWAEIDGLEGYEVSEEGDIRKVRKVSCLAGNGNGNVRITIDGKVYNRSIAKLVRVYHEQHESGG